MRLFAGKPEYIVTPKSPIVNKKSEYATRYSDFEKVFKISIPTRSGGKEYLIGGYDVKIYTDVSKMSC